MTEKQVGVLYKIASTLSPLNNNENTQLLRSYYLMRCKEITKGYGLPRQQFSLKNRCSYCCIEWTKNTDTKVNSIKLSKRQRKRINLKKQSKDMLHSNAVVQNCSFCNHKNEQHTLRPNIMMKKNNENNVTPNLNESLKVVTKNEISLKDEKEELNVYSTTNEVFSLSNQKNIITSSKITKPKAIKNNKNKKDKFAGLCKEAVLAAAKLKVKTEQPNKLSLFLKPSAP